MTKRIVTYHTGTGVKRIVFGTSSSSKEDRLGRKESHFNQEEG